MLFSPWRRSVAHGIDKWVSRQKIYTEKDFINFIDRNNGIHNCFIEIYSAILNSSGRLIDKIYFDLDYKPGVTTLDQALEETKSLDSWLTKNNFDTIPIVTGKKGFHVYVRTKPKEYRNVPKAKGLLKKAAYWILCETFGHEDGKIKAECVDPVVIGDISRIARIPTTLRPPENLAYCTYLPPSFTEMSLSEIIEHSKSSHKYTYPTGGKLWDLEDFPDPPTTILSNIQTTKIEDDGKDLSTTNGNKFLKDLLRPCLYRHMMRIHPIHSARVASTVDLLEFFNGNEIFNIYKSLQWTEWDSEITIKQIESCKHLKPYSCTRLRQLGIPRTCCID